MNRLMLVAATLAMFLPPFAQPALASPRGACVTAMIPTPFRLPDGLLYPAGALTLCDAGAFSPVVTFHRVFVDGMSIGLFRSQRRAAEGSLLGSPEILFHRDTDGTYLLIGYAMPTSGRVLAYRMKTRSEPRQAIAASGGGSATVAASLVKTVRGR